LSAGINGPGIHTHQSLFRDGRNAFHDPSGPYGLSSVCLHYAARGKATRVELRMPDPSCNPYLASAAMMAAGLDGTERRPDPGPPLNRTIYAVTEDELEAFSWRSPLHGAVRNSSRTGYHDPACGEIQRSTVRRS